ncbi:MAG: hypothetical protein KDE27_25925 [Planctomycetes bacterium]|nr:hypothetical protein [Planctomycetota bacterium]
MTPNFAVSLLTAALLSTAAASAQGSATYHGFTCAGDTSLTSTSSWSIGAMSSVDVDSFAGNGAFVSVGIGAPFAVGQGIQLAQYGLSCEFWTSPVATVPVINPQPNTVNVGYVVDVPNDPGFVGLPLTFQGLISAPWFTGGLAPTNALHIVIGQ